MLRNYLKIAFRNQRRHAGYALLNLVGLAVGMACCLLIALYVRDELTVDHFHEKADRIHRLAMGTEASGYGGGTEGIAKVPGPWGPAAVENVPGVEAMTRFVFYGRTLVQRGDQQFDETGGFLVDPSVFEVFSFELLQGDPATALTEPNTVVLTETLADKYFGNDSPIGESLLFDNTTTLTVTGVMANVPSNSHLEFDFLVSLEGDPAALQGAGTDGIPLIEDWRRNQFYTYLLLNEDADAAAVAPAFAGSVGDVYTDEQLDGTYRPFLQPLPDIYLGSNLFREIGPLGNATYVYLFAALALFILLLACVNYMNLATAQVAQRAKEVGVRKVNGASRGALMRQFLVEAVLMSFLALVLGVVLAEVLLPSFNALAGKTLTLDLFSDGPLLAALVGLGVVVGVLAGSYPAFLLSAFRPVQVLKKTTALAGGARLRRGLVVFQFAISAFLLIGTGIIGRQLDYIQTKNLGFDQEHIVTLTIRDDALKDQLETIKQELERHPGVVRVAASGNLPGGGDWGIPYEADGVDPDNRPSLRMLAVDRDFLDVFDMTLVAGTDAAQLSDSTMLYYLSETAVAQFGWSDPLEKTIGMPAVDLPRRSVTGVVQDFHYRSLHEAIEPVMLFTPPSGWLTTLSIKIRPTRIDETLAFLEETWTAFQPAYPFTYTFFDERFDELYQREQRIQALFNAFTLLALLIACLGLFGLSAFSAERRTKEIGVRKVLGASVVNLVGLLSKDFLKLVAVAFVIAAPLAYVAAQRWLDGFAYHTHIGLGVFILAGALALGIALVAVSYQSIRAALADPVKNLRYE